jgi:hypothetical protein
VAADFGGIVGVLADASVEVVLIGGLAAHAHGAAPGLPFRFDGPTIQRGLNFTLTTDLGDIDLLGEVAGIGGFDVALPHSIQLRVFERDLAVLDLPTLIRSKRAAGRPKDLEAIAELEALLVERERIG